MFWHPAVAVTAAMMAGFAAAPDQGRAKPTGPAAVGRPFTLAPGGRVKVKDEPIEVHLVRIVSDSRCPKGAQCIAAGEAVLAIEITSAGERAAHELRSDPPAAAAIQEGKYTIRLDKLDPYPQVGRRIDRSRYVATLIVSRR